MSELLGVLRVSLLDVLGRLLGKLPKKSLIRAVTRNLAHKVHLSARLLWAAILETGSFFIIFLDTHFFPVVIRRPPRVHVSVKVNVPVARPFLCWFIARPRILPVSVQSGITVYSATVGTLLRIVVAVSQVALAVRTCPIAVVETHILLHPLA